MADPASRQWLTPFLVRPQDMAGPKALIKVSKATVPWSHGTHLLRLVANNVAIVAIHVRIRYILHSRDVGRGNGQVAV